MTQRIDQLWAQALDAAVPETYTRLSHSQVLKIKQVFAELIVRECADIAKHHVMNISTYADADFVDEQIKQHFGVEE
jgi:hypothetical protein